MVNSGVKDKLIIRKSDEGMFVLSRYLEESLSKAEIDKRIKDVKSEKKRLINEKEKAQKFIEQADSGIKECDDKINALLNARDNGYGEM